MFKMSGDRSGNSEVKRMMYKNTLKYLLKYALNLALGMIFGVIVIKHPVASGGLCPQAPLLQRSHLYSDPPLRKFWIHP